MTGTNPNPQDYLTVEAMAAELDVPLYRVQLALRELGIPKTVFPGDRRGRYEARALDRVRDYLVQGKRNL